MLIIDNGAKYYDCCQHNLIICVVCKGGFPVIAETTREELASTWRLAEQFQSSHGYNNLFNMGLTYLSETGKQSYYDHFTN